MIYQDTFITVYVLAVAAVLGAVFGSFINCMAWRKVNGEKITGGRSHCPKCGHELRISDLVPILSYMFLKGKCRYCGEKISVRYAAVEALMAAAFVGTVWMTDVSFDALRIAVLACILTALSLVDLDSFEIPDGYIIAGIVWWAVMVFAAGESWQEYVKSGLIGAFAFGGGMLLLAMVFDKLTGKESLGGGDIKLFFMTGLYLGPWVGLLNLILSCVTGIIFVLCTRENKIPFGPSISAATFICLLFGNDIINWYLNLFI